MATKKITELPFIVTVSGSSVFDNPSVNSVVPVVLYGTTNQITVENFSKFTNLYAAQTGSQNIFTQNQWFNTTVSASTINVGTLGVGGNTTIAGTLGVTGNGTIGGNLAVAGRITAEEFYTEITTASVIYASGSTKFGDDTGDKHEFTGSINVSGSVIYNGVILSNIDANTIQRLQQATASIQQSTASLNTFTASQDDRNFILSQVTGSFAGEIGGLEAYTASLKTAAIVSSSTQIQNYNLFAVTSSGNTFYGNQSITGSLSVGRGQFNVVTGSGGLTSSLTFTHNITSPGDGNAILELRHNNRIYNDDIAIKLKADFAGAYLDYEEDTVPYSILSVQSFANKNVYIHQDTRLLFSNLTVDDNLVVKQDTRMTGSLFVMGVITGSILATNGVISSSNQLFELNQFTASQDGRNFTLSQVTGSLIGITNGLMAFTAALDNTYATDAQLYQLYQATRSLELHSGSMIGVTNGLMAYTASNTSLNTGLRGEVDGIEAYTASLKGQAIVSSSTQVQNYDVFALNSNLYTSTGSLIGITNGLMAFTAALDSTYATDAQLYQLYQATRSIELTTGSLIGITNGLMAFTAALDSTYATDAQLYQLYAETASIKAEIAGIEAYTASLKAAAIVSSSTQVQNYDIFALNSNLYNSTGSIKGEIAGIEAYTASLKGAIEVSGQNVNVLGMITAQQFNVTYVSSSVMYQSGSTEFGDSSDDRHLFTGSLIVSGTLAAGTDETGWGRISFNESTNTLRIQSSKNGTQCTPISFWSQRDGGTFAESMAISGSYVSINRLAASANYKLGVSGSAYINGANDKGIFVTDNATFASIVGLNSAISAYNPLELRASGTDYQLYLPTTGEVLMGTNTVGAQNSGAITFRTTTATYGGVMIMNHSTTNNTSAGYIDCFYNTSYIGGIAQNGASNVAFNTSSDYRLKEDLKDFGGLNLISNLKVYDFKWKTDNSRMYGVLAHELQEIIPYVVNGNKDEVKEDGKIKVQVVDYSKIVPILIKSIQEQQDIIEELKARIEALENK